MMLVPSGFLKALCDPSQKGWVWEAPQEHQKYFLPCSTATLKGALAAIFGKDVSVMTMIGNLMVGQQIKNLQN